MSRIGSMRTIFILLAAFTLFLASTATAQVQLEPGIYRATVSITKTIPSLKVREFTSHVLVGEVTPYPYEAGFLEFNCYLLYQPSIDKTHQSYVTFAFNPNLFGTDAIPDLTDTNGNFNVPGGTLTPGSLKLTTKSVSWKSTQTVPFAGSRKQTFTTSFTMTKTGPTPPPEL